MKRREVLCGVFRVVVIAGLAGCSPPSRREPVQSVPAQSEEGSTPNMVRATGTITYIALEGGFYGIVGDDGHRYDPVNLPKEFQQNGLRVRFEVRPRPDMASFHMWGILVEVVSISKL
ncbi:MAG: hypothetical protein QHJ73_06005 [Armatimonadota bacterium]|nr:hypothetical protein [Armatimonadota bacterium]